MLLEFSWFEKFDLLVLFGHGLGVRLHRYGCPPVATFRSGVEFFSELDFLLGHKGLKERGDFIPGCGIAVHMP
jgi:hypothetical protein